MKKTHYFRQGTIIYAARQGAGEGEWRIQYRDLVEQPRIFWRNAAQDCMYSEEKALAALDRYAKTRLPQKGLVRIDGDPGEAAATQHELLKNKEAKHEDERKQVSRDPGRRRERRMAKN